MGTRPETPNAIETIGILGAGQMGGGIAQAAAQSGFKVLLGDANLESARRGKEKIALQLKKLLEKGKIAEKDADSALGRITPVGSLSELAAAQIVIEAVSENTELKLKIFAELSSVCSTETILASNTSSISITKIASAVKQPSRVIGMHFMNPVPVMKLVEGIRGLQTSDHTASAVKSICEKMGKTYVEVRDIPGFAVNRILMPMINEAITALYEGIASAEDLDTAMKLGTNQPMGPLTLADFIGLDTCLAIMEVLHDGLGDSKYRPSPLLRQYVAAGWLGKKSGRGFYNYAQ